MSSTTTSSVAQDHTTLPSSNNSNATSNAPQNDAATASVNISNNISNNNTASASTAASTSTSSSSAPSATRPAASLGSITNNKNDESNANKKSGAKSEQLVEKRSGIDRATIVRQAHRRGALSSFRRDSDDDNDEDINNSDVITRVGAKKFRDSIANITNDATEKEIAALSVEQQQQVRIWVAQRQQRHERAQQIESCVQQQSTTTTTKTSTCFSWQHSSLIVNAIRPFVQHLNIRDTVKITRATRGRDLMELAACAAIPAEFARPNNNNNRPPTMSFICFLDEEYIDIELAIQREIPHLRQLVEQCAFIRYIRFEGMGETLPCIFFAAPICDYVANSMPLWKRVANKETFQLVIRGEHAVNTPPTFDEGEQMKSTVDQMGNMKKIVLQTTEKSLDKIKTAIGASAISLISGGRLTTVSAFVPSSSPILAENSDATATTTTTTSSSSSSSSAPTQPPAAAAAAAASADGAPPTPPAQSTTSSSSSSPPSSFRFICMNHDSITTNINKHAKLVVKFSRDAAVNLFDVALSFKKKYQVIVRYNALFMVKKKGSLSTADIDIIKSMSVNGSRIVSAVYPDVRVKTVEKRNEEILTRPTTEQKKVLKEGEVFATIAITLLKKPLVLTDENNNTTTTSTSTRLEMDPNLVETTAKCVINAALKSSSSNNNNNSKPEDATATAATKPATYDDIILGKPIKLTSSTIVLAMRGQHAAVVAAGIHLGRHLNVSVVKDHEQLLLLMATL